MTFLFFAIASILNIVVILFGAKSVKAFLSKHKTISDQRALKDFKLLARNNMKGALVMIVVGMLSVICSVALVAQYGPISLLPILTVNVPVYTFSQKMIKAEKRSRSLVCEPSLQAEYLRVGESWLKKAWPDF
ncbi:MAG: hypothetical protein AAF810_23825 [Cyanobacteria bacterium P01_D01_bin.36]